jgi:hypothetical protein
MQHTGKRIQTPVQARAAWGSDATAPETKSLAEMRTLTTGSTPSLNFNVLDPNFIVSLDSSKESSFFLARVVNRVLEWAILGCDD